MVNIVPAILAKNAHDFAKKLRLVEGAVKMVQIDAVDGKFAPFTSWADPEIIKTIPTPLKFELHLMVKDAYQEIRKWAKIKNVARIIFHAEAKQNHSRLVQIIKRKKLQVGIALNPRTPVKKIQKLIPRLDCVLILGVTPGRSGQKFQKSVLKKIYRLKKYRNIEIEVDGGVNLRNARKILAAGADTLCAASAIYKNPYPKKIINKFKQLKING